MVWTTVDTPLGALRLASDGTGLTELWLSDWQSRPTPGEQGRDAILELADAQLSEYFAGERTEFTIPLGRHGTAFQRLVWAELQRIPCGQTASYGEVARRIGRPTAVRAVARANATNPVGIVVPCHRVIGADGTLTGYAAGLERKAWLLAHEQALLGLASSTLAGVEQAVGG